MLEPDVTLTDYGLALGALVLGGRLGVGAASPVRGWSARFFLATALAAAAGGTVHGFFPDPPTTPGAALWMLTLLAVGGAGWAAWSVGGHLLGPATGRWVARAGGVAFVGYAVLVLSGVTTFRIALAAYLPATVFLGAAFLVSWRRTGSRAALTGVVGVLATVGAAGIQRGGLALHPRYFTSNALYHVVQLGALWLLYRAVRRLTEGRPGLSGGIDADTP